MKKIKIGIKISTKESNFLSSIYSKKTIIDFIEIILFPDFSSQDLDIIKNLKMPYAIHLSNSNNGIDMGNLNNKKENQKYIELINQQINKFKLLKPICYIIHPESGDIRLSINNIKKIKINPIAIENMPLKSIYGGECLGYDPDSLKEYFNQIKNLQFCFDLNHAIKTAISFRINYLDFIQQFLNFQEPIIFHISGGTLSSEIDEHLKFEQNQYNLKKIKDILLNYDKIIFLTFETPRDYDKGITDDLGNINYFLNLK